MSWDRDEAANSQEALDQLVRGQEEIADLLRQQVNSPRGENPGYGGEGGSSKFEIDLKPIADFVGNLRDANQQLRVFSRSMEMVSEKIEELLQNDNLKAAGSFKQQAGNTQQQQPQQLPPAYPMSALVKPSQQMIPNQYGGFNVYNMQNATAQPVTQIPANVLDPGKARRRNARRRSLLRKLTQKRMRTKSMQNIARGAYFGGITGGVRGAARGGLMSAGLRAIKNPYVMAAAAALAFPFVMTSTAAMAQRQMDQNRQYSVGAPGTLSELVKFDLAEFRRNLALSKSTSKTATELVQAQDKERESQQPFDIMMRNIGNKASTWLTKISESFFKNTEGLWNAINRLVVGEEGNGLMESGQAAVAMASGGALGAFAASKQNFMKQNEEAIHRERDRTFLDQRWAPKPRKI